MISSWTIWFIAYLYILGAFVTFNALQFMIVAIKSGALAHRLKYPNSSYKGTNLFFATFWFLAIPISILVVQPWRNK